MVALATLGSTATIAIAWATSFFISQVFIFHATVESVGFCLRWLVLGGLTKALVIWLQEFLATRAAAAVKQELRAKLFDSISRLGPSWLAKRSIAEVNLLATTGLDALDPYFSKYIPQLVYSAMITPVFVAIIWFSDISSGVTLLLTLPLIPIFMILIGWATQSVQNRQLSALTTLSQHFLEVLRGLTTLKVFGRVANQEVTLERVSREHRVRTMKVLRVSFLSGFALELIASLAVALIAVSIGLRLLSGDLSLSVGLFVLLLAPEAYLPLRQVGAQFHASAEGVAASKGILDIIDESHHNVSHGVQSSFDFNSIQVGKLNVIIGPSGAGKSTIFSNLLGFSGTQQMIAFEDCAWLPQAAKLFAGTVAANIVGPGQSIDSAALRLAMDRAALDDLAADHQVGSSGSALSGGQAQRVSLARAFYRAQTLKSQYLLLDEPTSALDERRAKKVIDSLTSFVDEGYTVVAISHQESPIAAAQNVIEVNGV
ncbi:MAG: ABC transporter ATP-binding protein/permease [Rhodoluna sp.]